MAGGKQPVDQRMILEEHPVQTPSSQPPQRRATKSPIADMLADVHLDPDQNITFQVFDILRDLIVSVRLRPGQRLSEKDIAAALSASKTPVREALIRLDEVNLVKIVPQSGTYVTKISVSRYTTACFIRLQLELGAVRAAASFPDPRHKVVELDEIIADQAEALTQDDFAGFFRLDDEFHRRLFILAGHGDVWTTARRTQFDLNRARHIRREHRILRGTDVLEEHAAITDAIRDRDPDRADAALRKHIGDLDRQVGVLFTDERLHGLIELPTPN